MICSKCNQKLPNDSEFCQYCGFKLISEESFSEETKEINQVNSLNGIIKAEEKEDTETIKQDTIKYCDSCGSIIDTKTNACTGCQKKHIKHSFNRLSVSIISTISVVLVFLIVFSIYQYVQIDSLEQEIFDLEEQARKANYEISNLEHERQKYYNKASFFDENAEIVISDDSNLCHKYDCLKVITSKGFRIFNTNAAKSLGYIQCPECH